MKARLTAVILAAGKGTRMCSERPKVLYELCGRPMLLYVLEAVRSVKPDRIVVVVGFGKDRVKEALAEEKGLVLVDQGDPRGTGHALQAAQSQWQDSRRVLVVCGDTPLLRGETLRHLAACHEEHAIEGVSVLTAELVNPLGYGRIVGDSRGDIAAIREESDASEEEKKVREVNAGVYLFDGDRLRQALKSLKPDNRQKELYLTDAIPAVRASGGRAHAHRCKAAEEILGANSIRELSELRRLLQERILERHMENGVEIVDPATTFIDEGVEIGPGTTILPCTVIRGAVKIGSRCEVGPFTHLRTGSRLLDGAEVGNFTEMKKATLGRRSKAKHLAYLGDARIGDGVNIGAGTITANYDGKGKYETVIRDGAFIGSGTVVVAPATIGRRAVTGAGAVITKQTRVPEGAVYVGVPAGPLVRKTVLKLKKVRV